MVRASEAVLALENAGTGDPALRTDAASGSAAPLDNGVLQEYHGA